jgi:hypothetical protein
MKPLFPLSIQMIPIILFPKSTDINKEVTSIVVKGLGCVQG